MTSFKPCCLATAIGSMPHRDPKKACQIVFENLPEIPVWPQLPNLSFLESMCVQFSEGMPGLRVDRENKKIYFDTTGDILFDIEKFYEKYLSGEIEHFAFSPERAAGFFAFLQKIKEIFSQKILFLKGQVTGPVTFGLTVTDEKKQPILYNDSLRDTIIKTLSLKAKWQEEQFKKINPQFKTIIFFDEPYLRAYGSAYINLNREDVIAYLNDCFSEVLGLKGIHVCANTDWGLLMETNVDIISFDAYDYTESLALYPKELERFLERGGLLAWGIVPGVYPTITQIAKEDLASLTNRFEQSVKVLGRKGFKKERLLESSLITPTCGTGSMSEELAEKTIKLTAELSKEVRRRYFG